MTAIDTDAAAKAALSICESLAIALTEQGILHREKVRGPLYEASGGTGETPTQDSQGAI